MQKRRIYDITNVLEGIGLIEKKLKNRIHWKYCDTFLIFLLCKERGEEGEGSGSCSKVDCDRERKKGQGRSEVDFGGVRG